MDAALTMNDGGTVKETDPRVTLLGSHLAARRDELKAAIDATPAPLRDASPGDGRWSIASVLEHLVQTERGIAHLLSQLIEKAPARAADEPFAEQAFARRIAMPYVLDRSRRLVGPQPSGNRNATAAWSALEQSRGELIQVVEGGAGRRLEDVSHAHPFLGALDLYEWIAFVGLHEARHADQIREIAQELKR